MLLILILLLIAAAAGVLGAVIKATLVFVLSLILAFVILAAGTYQYLRFRLRRLGREMERRHRAYPARGHRQEPPGRGPGELPS